MICSICSGQEFQQNTVLKQRLIDEWELEQPEVDYINRQQGFCCANCGANYRSMTLAESIIKQFKYNGNFKHFSQSKYHKIFNVLEINSAGSLHKYLSNFKNYTYAQYPEIDMQKMPYPSNLFDIIVHSDTLEHVLDSKIALSECLRVLKPGGYLFYTVPIIYGRLSRRRDNLTNSYHGKQDETQGYDHKVFTEYGADFWVEIIQAGFKEIKLINNGELTSIGIVCFKENFVPNYENSELNLVSRIEWKMKNIVKKLINIK